ncbi:MAG: GNAT family N-acetyltransferase [Actinobacteria bacterium]|nr:GNAT family N-acetyltransferase [Actinomycetota bacterium]
MPIRPLSVDDHAGAAAALATAFHADPMMVHLAPSDTRRARMLPPYFRSVLRQATAGVPLVTDGDAGAVAGCAIAMPPGTYPLPLLPQLKEWRTILTSGVRATVRHFVEIPPIERLHPNEPFWYLMYLGVDPTAQGSGHGRRLVRAVTDEADRDGVSTYLVTMKEANLGFYAGAGFELRDTARMGRHGPATWTMLRPPS